MTRPSPLAAAHASLGATMTEFAGWSMPLRYSSELAEHGTVRRGVGLFDLSHMAEIVVEGPGAAAALDAAVVGWMSRVDVGRARYTMLCAEDGGVIDDLVVYRTDAERYLVVANAANAAVVSDELARRCAGSDRTVRDDSEVTALVAVQGPKAAKVVARLVAAEDRSAVLGLRYYAALAAPVAGVPGLVARTGYTGEDGFEFFVPAADAIAVWNAAVEVGADEGIVPCGLACRDTLRLEAGMPLYGHELSRSATPFEAGLGRVVHFGTAQAPRGEFVGRDALADASRRVEGWENDPGSAPPDARVLVGLVGDGRRSPREGYPVLADGVPVGVVTSGAPSPTLSRPIAMAYVHPASSSEGTALDIDVRGRAERMDVTALPFYTRAR